MKLNNWVSSAQAEELLSKQLAVWPLAAQNYEALHLVRVKTLTIGENQVKVQYNPARMISAGAKVDEKALKERKCFLCPDNLPIEQIRLTFGSDYLFLCNPYPIFPVHFTISTRVHTDQVIASRLPDFLEMMRRLEAYTLFYNGPRSGASAPDHAHFQVVTRSVMPLDTEWQSQLECHGQLLQEDVSGQLYLMNHCLRNGFVIKARTQATAFSFFRQVCDAMERTDEEVEPKLNLFGYYMDKTWVLILIPRRIHRPTYYFREDEDRILTSPGCADIGGLFITVREEDYEKITPDIIRDVYQQVCLSDSDMERIVHCMNKNK